MEEKITKAETTNNTSTAEQMTILVKSISLFRKLIDMGFADKLCSVKLDRYREGRRIYFFDHDEAVRGIVDAYIKEKREKHASMAEQRESK